MPGTCAISRIPPFMLSRPGVSASATRSELQRAAWCGAASAAIIRAHPLPVTGMTEPAAKSQHVVIVGGGFGGLFAARALGRSNFRVTLLDKRNFHLFQPLLYQVATGALVIGDIATPQRVVLRRFQNVKTLMTTAYDIDPVRKV